MGKFIPMIGQKFHRLVVLSDAPKTHDGRRRYNCLCDCGKRCVTLGYLLRAGETRSCGCYLRERITKHGLHNSSTWKSWNHMQQRCENPKNDNFPRYGGRGITRCKRWREFTNFLADMGLKPSPKHSLERIDNTKGYSPENCRWATHAEQMSNTSWNRKLTLNGKTQTVAQWERELGFTKSTIYSRINGLGWTLEQALTTPLRPRSTRWKHKASKSRYENVRASLFGFTWTVKQAQELKRLIDLGTVKKEEVSA